MKRMCCFAFVAAFGLIGLSVWGQTTGGGAKDDGAIQQALAGYVQAFNKQDAAALTKFWAADAEYVSETGVVSKGRDAIGDLFRKHWKDQPGTSLKLKNTTTRLVSADVALQDGVAEIRSAGGDVDAGPFTAVWVKLGGQWLLSRVRDLPDPASAKDDSDTAKALRDLEWLVGEWSHEEGGTKVELSVRWFKNRTFLTLDQTVTKNGEEILSLTQMIGWDPSEDTLRSWMFDSRGGFGGGTWTREGNQWNVDAAGILADGRNGSAVNTWKFLSDDRFEWASTNREVDGRPSADIKVQYVRKAAKR